MRKILLLLNFSFLVFQASGQKFEISLNAGCGISFFGGKSSVSRQAMISPWVMDPPFVYYTNPFGRKPDFSYSAGMKSKLIIENKWITGIGVDYGKANTISDIDSLIVQYVIPSYNQSFSFAGKSKAMIELLSVTPFFGKRISLNKLCLDLSVGGTFGFLTDNKEKISGEIEDIGQNFNYYRTPYIRKTNFSLLLNAELSVRRMVFSIGYHHGLTNNSKWIYDDSRPRAYLRNISFNIGYRIK